MTGCRQQKPRLGLTKCPDLVDHYNMSGQEFDSPECFFTRSGYIFGCPDIGAVKAPQVEVDKPFFIEMQLQHFKDGIDAACTLPT